MGVEGRRGGGGRGGDKGCLLERVQRVMCLRRGGGGGGEGSLSERSE